MEKVHAWRCPSVPPGKANDALRQDQGLDILSYQMGARSRRIERRKRPSGPLGLQKDNASKDIENMISSSSVPLNAELTVDVDASSIVLAIRNVQISPKYQWID